MRPTTSGGIDIYDRALGRFTLVGPDRSVAEVFTLARETYGRPPHLAWRLAPSRILSWEFNLGDATLLSRHDDAERVVSNGTLRVVDLASGVADTLIVAPAREVIRQGSRLWLPPFGITAMVEVVDGQIYYAAGVAHEILSGDAAAFPTASYRYPHADHDLTRSELGRLRDEANLAATAEGVPFAAELLFEPTLQPRFRPAFEGLHVGSPSGQIWMRRFEPFQAASTTYWLASARGRFLGQVRLPPRTQVMAVIGDTVVVRRLDSLDVPSIEFWRVGQLDGSRP
jgi:hypothetical protein